MPRQRVQDPKIRKQQILKAAQTVLTKKPYSHLVMDDIAREAGISKGLLYLYFKDKESLFAEVASDLLCQLSVQLEGIDRELSSLERLELMVSIILAFGEEHKEFTAQFVPEQIISSGRASSILEEYEEFLKQLEGFFQDAIDSKIMRPHSTRTSAMVSMEIMMLYVRRKFIHKEFLGPLNRRSGEVLDMILSGFGFRGRPSK